LRLDPDPAGELGAPPNWWLYLKNLLLRGGEEKKSERKRRKRKENNKKEGIKKGEHHGPTFAQSQKLESLQKRALRIIHPIAYDMPYDSACAYAGG